ncbi:MAG: ABC-2 family transporter protein [Holosporaceae bacterium]|jgi:ABC-2 type transport system permease protein
MTIGNYLYLMGSNIASSCTSYRRFALEAGMMFVNNAVFFLIWIFFFRQFGELRGYDLPDMVGLFAMTCLSLGFFVLLMDGVQNLSRYIVSGELERFLNTPCHPIPLIIFSGSRASGLGDILFGLVVWLGFAQGSWQSIPWVLVIGLLCATIIAAAMFCLHCLSFWHRGTHHSTEQVYNSFLIFSSYPTHIYEPLVKVLLMTVFPAGLIATLPMAILHQHRIWAVIALPLAVLLWVRLASWLFRRGLRRYVSGNEIFA